MTFRRLLSALALMWFLQGTITGSRAAVARITNLAGTGTSGYTGDHGPANQARLGNPYGVVRGPDGAAYVCEVDNHVIRRIAPDGTISTVAGTGWPLMRCG